MLAYFVLRILVGGMLIYLGVLHLRHREELRYVLVLSWFPFGRFSTWMFGISELILGVMFVLGFFTQIAAVVTALMSLKLIILSHWFQSRYIPERLFYLLLFGTSLSLLITGAGAFAFDLPI